MKLFLILFKCLQNQTCQLFILFQKICFLSGKENFISNPNIQKIPMKCTNPFNYIHKQVKLNGVTYLVNFKSQMLEVLILSPKHCYQSELISKNCI